MGLDRELFMLRSQIHCNKLILLPKFKAYNPTTKVIETVATANQDPLLGYTPLVGIDLWEYVLLPLVSWDNVLTFPFILGTPSTLTTRFVKPTLLETLDTIEKQEDP